MDGLISEAFQHMIISDIDLVCILKCLCVKGMC